MRNPVLSYSRPLSQVDLGESEVVSDAGKVEGEHFFDIHWTRRFHTIAKSSTFFCCKFLKCVVRLRCAELAEQTKTSAGGTEMAGTSHQLPDSSLVVLRLRRAADHYPSPRQSRADGQAGLVNRLRHRCQPTGRVQRHHLSGQWLERLRFRWSGFASSRCPNPRSTQSSRVLRRQIKL